MTYQKSSEKVFFFFSSRNSKQKTKEV